MIPIVFCGGQRSFEVTRGQTMKTMLIQYLKKGNMDESHTWLVDVPYWAEGPYRFWWRSKVIWRHVRSKSENLLNTVSQEGNIDESHIWPVQVPYWVNDPYCFWWTSKVIWGHYTSNAENFTRTTSQEGKHGWISYLSHGCSLLTW